jgi:hypothetical protein
MRALSLAFLRLRQILYNRFQRGAPSVLHCMSACIFIARAIEAARFFPRASLRNESLSQLRARALTRAASTQAQAQARANCACAGCGRR